MNWFYFDYFSALFICLFSHPLAVVFLIDKKNKKISKNLKFSSFFMSVFLSGSVPSLIGNKYLYSYTDSYDGFCASLLITTSITFLIVYLFSVLSSIKFNNKVENVLYFKDPTSAIEFAGEFLTYNRDVGTLLPAIVIAEDPKLKNIKMLSVPSKNGPVDIACLEISPHLTEVNIGDFVAYKITGKTGSEFEHLVPKGTIVAKLKTELDINKGWTILE